MAQITSGSLTIVDVTDGAPGLNNTTVFLYRRAVSAPSKPTGNLTYTFSTASITGALEGWVQSINELTGSDPIWMIAAVASSNGETDVIESSEWAGPIKMAQNGQDGLPGTPGTNGLNQATIFIYKRDNSATAPSSTTYTFATGGFTVPSGWSKTIPTEPKGKPCWVTSAIAIGAEATAELNWVAPSVLVENGSDGVSPTVTATANGVKIVDADGNETFITNGADGTSYYTFVRYSKNANGSGYVVTPTSETIYIGVYTGTKSSPPAYNDSGWTWSKYVGADGQPGTQGPTGPTGPQGVSVVSTRELYYLKTNSTDPAQITNANQIHTTDDVNQWTSVVPTYIGSGKYYTCIETTLSNGNVVWSAPIENKGLTDANVNAVNAIEIARGVKQHFFWVTTDKSANVPAGAYVAEESEESFYSNPTKGNILTRSDGIWIRNGIDKLATLQGSGLTFLVPTGTYKGQKSVSLSGSGLTFYNIGSSNSAAATLASDGLQITNGSIVLGTTSGTAAGNVTLSNKNFTRSINGTSHNDLRFAIGSKFGVASDGTLYATGGVFDSYYTKKETEEAIDDIEIGGRNLARGTASMAEGDGLWSNGTWRDSESSNTYSYTVNDSPVAGVDKGVLITTASAGARYGIAQDHCPMQNRKITYSVWAKGTAGGKIRIQSVWWNGITITDWLKNTTATGSWQYITITTDLSKTSVPDGNCSICYMYWTGVNANDTCIFVAPKLEYGTKATDWTPAPEDVQAEIDAKKSVHTVTGAGSDASASYATILSYNERTLTYIVDSSAGIKIGDTVRIKVLVSDFTGTPPVYIVGTVTAIPSSTKVTMLAHGIDTTIIDGGNILTNSIGANKIKVNELTIGQSQVSGLSTALTNTKKLYKHNVDLTGSSYNQNTWYPVLIGECPETDASIYFKCSIVNGGGTPSWSSHPSKHWACEVEASYSVSRWGWKSDTNSYIDAYTFGQTSMKPIALSNELSTTAYLVVYLRGGGYYPIQTSIANTPQIKTSSYTINSRTVAPTTTQPVNTENFVISRREGDTKANEAATTATNYISASSSGIRIASANPATQYQRMELTSSEAALYSGDNIKRVSITANTGVAIGNASKGHTVVTDSGLTVFNSAGTDIAALNTSLRIGPAGKARAEVTGSGLDIYNANNEKRAYLGGDWLMIGDPNATRITMTVSGNDPYVYMNANGQTCFRADKDGVHLYDQNSRQRSLLNTNGLLIYDESRNNVAQFGVNVIIGRPDKSRVYITPDNGMRVYDKNNKRRLWLDWDGFYLYDDNEANMSSFTPASIRLGKAADRHLTLDPTNGMQVFTGAESTSTNVAQFSDTVRIGKDTEGKVVVTNSGIDMYGYDANASPKQQLLCHIGYGNCVTDEGTAYGPYFSFGMGRTWESGTIGLVSMAEGYYTKASGFCAHAEGFLSEASKTGAHAEGSSNATAAYAHAEGDSNASGEYSHAEGSTNATANYAHSEGYLSSAEGVGSHAEGNYTRALGNYSHTSGVYTSTGYEAQFAIGKYNRDDSNYLFMVGNGSSSKKSNAFAVTKSGTIIIGDHSSSVGSVLRAKSTITSLATSTAKALASLTIPIGTWILVGKCRFGGKAGAVRRLVICTTSGDIDFATMAKTDGTGTGIQVAPGASSAAVQHQVTHIVSVTADTTFYFNAWHNAGSTLDIAIAQLEAVRIA